MKKLLLICLAMTLASQMAASSIIQKPGLYTSDQKSSELSIQEKDKKISFVFTYKEKDGRCCTSSGIFDSSLRWAFILEGETKFWLYKGEDTVMSINTLLHSEPQVSFTSEHTILQLQIMSDRDSVPKDLLEFIDHKPNPSSLPGPTAPSGRGSP